MKNHHLQNYFLTSSIWGGRRIRKKSYAKVFQQSVMAEIERFWHWIVAVRSTVHITDKTHAKDVLRSDFLKLPTIRK